MPMILSIAAGGALGATLRYAAGYLATHIMGHGFPWGTLFVNVTGSFMMGVFISLFAHFWNPPQEARAFLTVGMLGAFTTFSTFSLDTVALFERGEMLQTIAYFTASTAMSIAALFIGMILIRQFAS